LTEYAPCEVFSIRPAKAGQLLSYGRANRSLGRTKFYRSVWIDCHRWGARRRSQLCAIPISCTRPLEAEKHPRCRCTARKSPRAIACGRWAHLWHGHPARETSWHRHPADGSWAGSPCHVGTTLTCNCPGKSPTSDRHNRGAMVQCRNMVRRRSRARLSGDVESWNRYAIIVADS
jgi:hypothetical protein